MHHPFRLENVVSHQPRNQVIRFDTGLLKLQAEYDYLMARCLVTLPLLLSNTLFHYQQCIEKYLKAYLAYRNNPGLGNGHDLTALVVLCQPYSGIFLDSDLESACSQLTPFNDIGRYPDDRHQSYGLSFPAGIQFLDEFVYEMRKLFVPRAEGENMADGIEAVYVNVNHPLSASAQLGSRQLWTTFLLDNGYAQLIMEQMSYYSGLMSA